jgi:hypothetical protein
VVAEADVSELLLGDLHRDTFHHELVGVGVTQPVRVDPLGDRDLFRQFRKQRAEVGA